MNIKSMDLMKRKIFAQTTSATISDPTHGQAFARIMVPDKLTECDDFSVECQDLMGQLLMYERDIFFKNITF